MKLLKAPLMAAMVGVSALGLVAVSAPTATQAQAPAGTVPIDVWALRSVVNAVQISPDGKHILVHVNPSKEGEYLLQVYKTDDLSKPFRTINADPMEIINAQWVSDDFIFGTAWQVKRKQPKRPEQDIRSYRAFSYNPITNEIKKADGAFNIVNTLPKEPDTVIIGSGRAIPDSSGRDPFAAFRSQAYYKFNLKTGSRSLILKGSSNYPQVQLWDGDGNPRYTTRLDRADGKLKTFYRKSGASSWTAFQETDFKTPENVYKFFGGNFGLVGFKHDDPNIAYLIHLEDGEDKAGLYEFDVEAGTIGKKLFQAEDADVLGIQTHSIPGNNKLVAAVYPGPKLQRHWFDEDEKALYEALEQQIPHAHNVSITSRSRDGRSMIVSNNGPRDPGSFWLVKDGQLAKLGSRNPELRADQLSDVKYIRYKARDGMVIPGYITVPKGEGPFPLIVQHNGGPAVNGMVSFDEMGQMFANAGYMVFHPENRISTGWGKKHFDAGYKQHGLAMQDDKDDGVKYLIEQGLVDPDRVAFFGWSYGGYAALVAAAREDNLYQCTIAVNGVADAEKQYLGRNDPGLGALDDWNKHRGGTTVNPVKEVEKVNIPVLMAHSSADRRVMYYHYKDYKKAFEAAGKEGQFITIEGADHFSNTLMFKHQKQLYSKMLDFLANDCGPGGL